MERYDKIRNKEMRKRLIDGLRIKGIRDERVLEAMSVVPRHLFMDSSYIQYAYKDQAFPIGFGQTISQPYTVAFQTLLLDIRKHDKVLEVGTGSGYQAAILIQMGAIVYSIERQQKLFEETKKRLPQLGYSPNLFFGDGTNGLPQYSPYDKIIVTAGAPVIPENLINQLKIGGKMVIPVGKSEKQTMVLITRISQNETNKENHGTFLFVPLLKGTVNR